MKHYTLKLMIVLVGISCFAQEVNPSNPQTRPDDKDKKIEQLTKLLNAYQREYFTCMVNTISEKALAPSK